MAENEHIDKEIFHLLLTSGVYRNYAERYLSSELMDVDDIQQFLD
ncbi:hypothetical protein P3719_24175 [Vibrio parahaemolyticus]|nr:MULTISPECIES: hypothetical protein [Vibrio]MDW1810373.1 hypothetical protein [Vibrio sp. Vb2362]MDW2297992.1 hypothetical protein [Vibrio sp. 1404]MDF4471728.1 hypothetical protein [Vibrio parahaemolyticus]MDF5575980.1 hypothetical protein [Vibrio parahaemolyticus]MDF5585968.1 hypothetical protein [Vibrio parahaemolyticus]